LRVKKDIPQEESQAMFYGKEAHKAAENYIREDAAIPPQFSYLEPYLNVLKKLEGEKLCEYEMGLTKELEPCSFKDKYVWWRGIADLIVNNKSSAYVVDYKTGKNARYADTKQLDLLSLATFKHFPKIQKIKAGLLFVVAKNLIKKTTLDHKFQKYGVSFLQKPSV
jgi:ATP-dependent exoDNAse (exonuclease V) beta subunit